MPAMFYDTDWKNLLLGTLNVHGEEFTVAAGLLAKALQENKKGIVLHNAPWHKSDFRVFITELLIKRQFYFNGELKTLPADFEIVAETVK